MSWQDMTQAGTVQRCQKFKNFVFSSEMSVEIFLRINLCQQDATVKSKGKRKPFSKGGHLKIHKNNMMPIESLR